MDNEQHKRRRGRPFHDSGEIPLKDQILKHAMRAFVLSGYDGVSVDEIARICGVTKATVYYYYRSKAVLLTEAMIHLLEGSRQATLKRLKQPLPLRDRLLDITKVFIQVTFFDFETYMRKLEQTVSSEQAKAIRQAEERLNDAIADEFAISSDKGEIGAIDPKLAARAYMALLMLAHAKHADGTHLLPNPEQAAEQIVHLLWQGIVGANPASAPLSDTDE